MTPRRCLGQFSALSTIPTVNFHSRVLDQPKDIARAINEHFVTVGPKLASSIGQKPDDNPWKYLKGINENMPKFQFTQVDTNYIKKAAMALKSSKSFVPGKIPVNS